MQTLSFLVGGYGKVTQQTVPQNGKTQIAGYLVGIGFLIVATMFVFTSKKVDIPIHEQPSVQARQIVPGAFRVALSDPPMINTGTYDQRCNDCHTHFENTRVQGRALTQHTHVRLEHGANDACLNCHDKGNRELLTLRGGETVGFDKVELLCAQCHGPIYRDWENGTHGKTIGYWNTDLGEATKLTCSQCHDPHSPRYEPMQPLPGPNTLRMGDQHSGHGDLINERDPLQRWRLLENNDSNSDGHDTQSGHGGDHE